MFPKTFAAILFVLLGACSVPKRTAIVAPSRLPAYGQNQRTEVGDDEKAGAELLRSFVDRRTPPGSELKPEKYLDAREHIARMPQFSLSEGALVAANTPPISLGGWAPLGPSGVGGRTRSLLIHPTNPLIMWAGAVS
jgi:hypothetical protein